MPGEFHRIVWTGDDIKGNIQDLPPKVHRAVDAVMRYHEPKVQSYMRSHASWEDQTGNARQGLFAQAYEGGSGGGRDALGRFTASSGHVHGIVLFHTMPYGIYLETRWSGKYAIIVPTIEEKGPEVMRTVQKLMERIG